MSIKILKNLLKDIKPQLGKSLVKSEITLGELSITVKPETIHEIMTVLRDSKYCHFKQLMDITAVDWPERTPRFDVVYHLLSLNHNVRIRVKAEVGEETIIQSISGVFSTANWFEREVWDMYGLYFNDHPDLRRILTDYGFDGHPLRKDFPLTGHVEVRYDEEQKRVVYEPVKLQHDFRKFDFLSPWEGMNDLLPGDEKAQTTGLDRITDLVEDRKGVQK